MRRLAQTFAAEREEPESRWSGGGDPRATPGGPVGALLEVAAVLARQVEAGPGGLGSAAAEDACAALMRALVGSAPARDDIAVLMLSRNAGQPAEQGAAP